MSKAGDALQAIGIYNPHNAVTQALHAGVGNGIYLSRRARGVQRDKAALKEWEAGR